MISQATSSTTKGRPPGWAVDVEVVRRRQKARCLTQQAVEDESRRISQTDPSVVPVTAKSYSNALSKGRFSTDMVRAVTLVLKLRPTEFLHPDENFPWEEATRLNRILNRAERQRAVRQDISRIGAEMAQRPQDVKNVISDPTISEGLITNENPPALLDAVKSTLLFPAINSAHKDQPFAPGFSYNHFLQISAVVQAKLKGGKNAVYVGYFRHPRNVAANYLHTQGYSVLWATSYKYNLNLETDLDMLDWVETANNEGPQAAKELFLNPHNGTLLNLLDHKLAFEIGRCEVSPLGVITNDQRNDSTGCKRVYTQYAFLVDITPHHTFSDEKSLVRNIVRKHDDAVTIAPIPQADTQLMDERLGKKNAMDALIWRSLFSSKNRLVDQNANFERTIQLTTTAATHPHSRKTINSTTF